MSTKKFKFNYYIGSMYISSDSINDLKDFVENISNGLWIFPETINIKSEKEVLNEFITEIKSHTIGNDWSKYISDFMFSVETDYQSFYSLEEDNFEKVH